MDKSFDLITIDKSWVDLIIEIPAIPGNDQKIVGQHHGRQPGGMGNNVACAASRLGLRAGVVSWIGDDADGDLVREGLRAFNVDTSHLMVQPGTITNYTVVMVDPSGEKAILVVPTTHDVLVLDSSLKRYLRKAQIVYATSYDLEQLARVAEVVHTSEGLMTTDLEQAAALSEDALAEAIGLVDILFINETLLEAGDLEQAALDFCARGPRLVAVTAGAGGAAACYQGESSRVPAFDVPVTDTTGAGDCFAAAFLAAFLRQRPLRASLLYAQAAAAITLQEYGIRNALPTEQEIQAFLAEHKIDLST